MLGMCEKQQRDLCGWSAVSEGGVVGTELREVMGKTLPIIIRMVVYSE